LAVEPLAHVALIRTGLSGEFGRRERTFCQRLVQAKTITHHHQHSVDGTAEIDERFTQELVKPVFIKRHSPPPQLARRLSKDLRRDATAARETSLSRRTSRNSASIYFSRAVS
jgi:hypothetical protein